jgi:hypothetical protein
VHRLLVAGLLSCLSCGARTELQEFVSAAGGAGAAGAGAAGGEAGAPPMCDPPLGVERIGALAGVREIAVWNGWIYGLSATSLFRIPACGGDAVRLADNPEGEGSLRPLTVGPSGIDWGSSGSDAHIMHARHDGGDLAVHQAPGVLTVGSDGVDAYFLTQAGNVIAHRSTGDTLVGSVGFTGYFSPMVVRDGWITIAYGGSSPNGQMQRISTQGGTQQMLLSGRVPNDMEVHDDQVTLAIAHGINQVQTFNANTLDLVILAADQPTPLRIAVGEDDVFFTTNEGLRSVPKQGGDVQVVDSTLELEDVTVDQALVYFVTASGEVFRAPP